MDYRGYGTIDRELYSAIIDIEKRGCDIALPKSLLHNDIQ